MRGCTPMSWSIRRAVLTLAVVAGLLSAALLHTAHAQPVRKPLPPPGNVNLQPDVALPPMGIKNPDDFSDSLTLPKDKSLADKLIAAGDYIKLEDWVESVSLLQRLIEMD